MKFPINRNFDWKLFLLWLLLVSLGVVAIFSASTTKIENEITRASFYWKQIIFLVFSLICMFAVLKIPATIIDIFIYPGYIITIILLIVVLFLPAINNSNRWISLAGFRIQPSEIAKIVLILLIARILSKESISNFQKVVKPLTYIILPFILILKQPDLGTGLVLFVAFFIMLAQAGFPLFYLLLLVSPLISVLTSFYIPAFIIFSLVLIYLMYRQKFAMHFISFILVINLFFLFLTPVLWGSLKPYQQNRILTFIDPTRDPLNTGYQVIQAKIAVGSGQLFGKGFLEGTQKNMNFLPEHQTDFIFSVISEEFGFLGSVFLLIVYMFFFLRIISNINKSEIKERRVAMAGILGFLFFQVLVNIGMNIGLMPTTGIPLPFISYGGSNLLVNSIAVALILKYSQERDV